MSNENVYEVPAAVRVAEFNEPLSVNEALVGPCKLNEEIEKNVNTSKEINEQKKSDMIKEQGSDLAETQKQNYQTHFKNRQIRNNIIKRKKTYSFSFRDDRKI